MSSEAASATSVEPEIYRFKNGFSAQREHGTSPKGNPVGGHWVLRDAQGAWVDMNQYRHDLFEAHGLSTSMLVTETRS